MNNFLRYYSLAFSVALIIGEAIVMLSTEKYWPLSLDDFIGVAALLAAIVINLKHSAAGLYLASWTYIAGNIYAVLFMRLDPVTGSGERIALVALVLGASLVGCVVAFLNYRSEYLLTYIKQKSEN